MTFEIYVNADREGMHLALEVEAGKEPMHQSVDAVAVLVEALGGRGRVIVNAGGSGDRAVFGLAISNHMQRFPHVIVKLV